MTSVNVSAVTNTVTVVEGSTSVVTVTTAGPQGPSGDAVGLPTGGDPGSVLMKTTGANYDTNWAPTLDGGTFN
jgi:hypothetical protein